MTGLGVGEAVAEDVAATELAVAICVAVITAGRDGLFTSVVGRLFPWLVAGRLKRGTAAGWQAESSVNKRLVINARLHTLAVYHKICLMHYIKLKLVNTALQPDSTFHW